MSTLRKEEVRMNSRIVRRLQQIEAQLIPRPAKVLKILVTSVGELDRTIELPLPESNGGRRRFWRKNEERER